MTFDRAHHRNIATVLGCLDADLLRDHGCYFGGGTAMALRFGEYRESVDIDFLVSDPKSFHGLRALLTGGPGLSGILIAGQRVVDQASPMRSDQYGIRTAVSAGSAHIKFEIVHEGRISLDTPGTGDQVCGVTSLTMIDLVASKLLANSDRWMDDGVFSRDIIDLAMMQPALPGLRAGLAKACAAYGDAAGVDAARAIGRLRTREGWLDRCMKTMAMTMPKAVLVQRLRRLALQLAATEKGEGGTRTQP